jgi:hypothetical protein
MTAMDEAQLKVANKVEELERDERLIDLACPDPSRRMSFEDSMQEIEKRYSRAIDLLGKL